MGRSNSGKVVLDWAAIELAVDAYSTAELASRSGVNSRTIAKMKDGLVVQRTKAIQVMKSIGIKKPDLFIKGTAENNGGHIILDPRQKFRDWVVEEKPSRWCSTPNGLDYRISKVRNSLLGEWGRGKCYDLESLTQEDRDEAGHILLKHPKICRKLEGHKYFPRMRDAGFELDNFFWVVDHWEDATTLETFIVDSEKDFDQIANIALDIANGINALHENGIVRRNLSPENVFIRKSDKSAFLTDFELARILEEPSQPFDYKPNSFVAPEVASGDFDQTADLFSFAQVLVFCLTGKVPGVYDNVADFKMLPIPKSIPAFITAARSQRSLRPKTLEAIIPCMEKWAQREISEVQQ